MTRRNTGGFLSGKEQATDSNSANGVFTLSEAAALTTGGNFPVGSFAPNRSARFRSAASAYLTRSPATAGNQQIFTESVWFKRGSFGVGQWIGLTTQNPLVNYVGLFLNTSNVIDAYIHYNGSTWTGQLTTTQVFLDPAAWYHIVLAVDTTLAAASSRIKLYVNGKQVTSFSTASYPAQNTSTLFNAATQHVIGAQSNNANYFDGYLSEMNWIDGQQLTPSAFGQTDAATGAWVPKRYSGSYGTNGFYLPFNLEDSGSLGAFFSSDYLVVAGGGGGSSAEGGGAGGGGMVEGAVTLSTGIRYSVTVGAGGALSSNGGNSMFAIATGFGGGASRTNGGSGGGGGNENGSSNQGNAIQVSPLGGTGYGFPGGNKTGGGGYANGGGGGAGGTGGNSTSFAAGGSGGSGRASSLSGSSITYAAGGGGWGNSSSGGGGSGATGANSGRGGNSAGTTGSSGVVIIKIPDTRTATFSAGVTVSGGSASGGFKIYSVTATSTTSETVIFS